MAQQEAASRRHHPGAALAGDFFVQMMLMRAFACPVIKTILYPISITDKYKYSVIDLPGSSVFILQTFPI
jgi:hypothetical protein